MSLRRRGYLAEAAVSQWREEGRYTPGMEWMGGYAKELGDTIEKKLAAKVYKVKFKKFKRHTGTAEIAGDLAKGRGTFSIMLYITAKPTGMSHKTKALLSVTVGGKHSLREREFAGTAAQNTIAKWVNREINFWR